MLSTNSKDPSSCLLSSRSHFQHVEEQTVTNAATGFIVPVNVGEGAVEAVNRDAKIYVANDSAKTNCFLFFKTQFYFFSSFSIERQQIFVSLNLTRKLTVT